MPSSDVWAVEAVRRLREEILDLRAKLTELVQQVDHKVLQGVADLQVIGASAEPRGEGQASAAQVDGDGESRPEQLLISLQRSKHPLITVTKGNLCAQLRREEWSDKRIAAAAGCDERYVEMLIGHAALPPEVREMIEAKWVSATLAYETWQGNKCDTIIILRTAISEAAVAGKHRVTEPAVKSVIRRRNAAMSNCGSVALVGQALASDQTD